MNRMSFSRYGITLCMMFLLALPLSAHHSRSNFQLDKTIEIEATVVRWQYRNPHAFLHVDATNTQGQIERWVMELGSIVNLKQINMHRDTLQVGDKLKILANPNRNPDTKYLFFKSLVTADGTSYAFAGTFDYSRKAREDAKGKPGSTDFTGIWDEEISREQILLGSGLADYPASELGLQILANYDESEEPSFSCRSAGIPKQIGNVYAVEYSRDASNYYITYELPATTRTIHMNIDTHPENITPSVFGHSIGRIENGALIVDTVGFSPTKWGLGDGLDSSTQKHLLETHQLNEGGHLMEITYTVTDPVFLTKAFSRKHIKRYVPDYVITEYEPCNLEAAGMHLQQE